MAIAKRAQSLVEVRRKARVVEKHLKDLTTAVRQYLAQLDVLMNQPSTVERGRKIARLSNALEMANDAARYFGLGVPLSPADRKAPDGRV